MLVLYAWTFIVWCWLIVVVVFEVGLFWFNNLVTGISFIIKSINTCGKECENVTIVPEGSIDPELKFVVGGWSFFIMVYVQQDSVLSFISREKTLAQMVCVWLMGILEVYSRLLESFMV